MAVAGIIVYAQTGDNSQPRAEPVILTDEENGFYPLGFNLEYLEDPTGKLTLQEVTSPEYQDRFTIHKTGEVNFGYTASVYWFRFEVNNQTPDTTKWLLEVGAPFLDYIDLYLIDPAGQIDHRQAGDQYSFDQRELDHRNFIFRLTLPANSSHVVYLRLQNRGRIAMSPAIWEPTTFALVQYRLMLGDGLFYGALLIMAVYHAILAIFVRDSTYLYYALYIILVGLQLASWAGLDAQFLWPNLLFLRDVSSNAFALLSAIVLLIFSAKFLHVKRYSLILFRVLQVVGVIHLLNLVGLFTPFQPLFFRTMVTAMMLVVSLLLLGTGLYIYRKGYRPARFYLVSWGVFLIGVMLSTSVTAGYVPSTPITSNIVSIMFLPALMFLSLGLADRINLFKQERAQAQAEALRIAQENERLVREQNITLEYEVAHRTRDLRESEERFAAILNSVEAIIYVSDMDTYEVLFINKFARNIFGDVVGKICWQTLQQGQSGPCEFCTNPYLLKNNRPTGIYTWEFQNTLTNRWYHIQNQAITWSDGRLVRMEVATDITHVKEAEHQRQQLVALEERERIGRELHDDLGQVMGYMNVQAQAVRELLVQNKTAQADVALGQLIEAATHAHTDVRRYILGIRTDDEPVPAQTDVEEVASADLITVLQQYLDELHRHYPLTVHLSLPDEEANIMLAPETGTQLLRIIQEALTNVRKHAGVDTVRVYLFADTDHVRVVIEDEGRGFDLESVPDTLDNESSPGHFGLKIMRERAESVGGTFQVKSSPNEGTKIIVQVPKVIPVTTVGKFEQGLRVLLVDDHPMFLEGIHTLLSVRGLHVVGTARDGLEAQKKARALLPDLILMDVDMPRCNGVEATQRIKTELPDTRIVMLTVAADDDTLFTALKAGASGYLLKSLSSDEFYRLLKNMVRGEIVLAPELAARMLAEFQQGEITASPAALQQDKFPELTAQQVEILDYAAQGLTYKEIATIIHLTERTIRYHMGQIVEHLQLKNRREAIVYARSKGLGQSTS